MTISVSAPTSTLALPYAERALNPATWDLAYPAAILRGAPAIIQRLRVRISFFLGEWFLDTNQGVPYRERVFIKNPKPPVVDSTFRQIISTTPGVMSVPTCRLGVINGHTRAANLNFIAKLSDGSVITAVNEPFIILPGIG